MPTQHHLCGQWPLLPARPGSIQKAPQNGLGVSIWKRPSPIGGAHRCDGGTAPKRKEGLAASARRGTLSAKVTPSLCKRITAVPAHSRDTSKATRSPSCPPVLSFFSYKTTLVKIPCPQLLTLCLSPGCGPA